MRKQRFIVYLSSGCFLIGLLLLFLLLQNFYSPKEQALQKYWAGLHDVSRKTLEQAQIDNPEDSFIAFNLGVTNYRSKKFEDAKLCFIAAVKNGEFDKKKNANSYANVGNCDFSLALKSASESTDWLSNEKLISQTIQLLESAVSWYQNALDCDSDDQMATNNNRKANELLAFLRNRIKDLAKQTKENKNGKQREEDGRPNSGNAPEKQKSSSGETGEQKCSNGEQPQQKQDAENGVEEGESKAASGEQSNEREPTQKPKSSMEQQQAQHRRQAEKMGQRSDSSMGSTEKSVPKSGTKPEQRLEQETKSPMEQQAEQSVEQLPSREDMEQQSPRNSVPQAMGEQKSRESKQKIMGEPKAGESKQKTMGESQRGELKQETLGEQKSDNTTSQAMGEPERGEPEQKAMGEPKGRGTKKEPLGERETTEKELDEQQLTEQQLSSLKRNIFKEQGGDETSIQQSQQRGAPDGSEKTMESGSASIQEESIQEGMAEERLERNLRARGVENFLKTLSAKDMALGAIKTKGKLGSSEFNKGW